MCSKEGCDLHQSCHEGKGAAKDDEIDTMVDHGFTGSQQRMLVLL